jgi:3',5'-cyclic AMP phosphodiesterase CpdA
MKFHYISCMGRSVILIFILLSFSAFSKATKIAVISDLNSGYGSTTYSKDITKAIDNIINHKSKPDIVIATGDLVAGMSKKLASSTFAKMWKSFHSKVSSKLKAAGIKFFPTPGNHDASSYSGYKRERAEYARQWPKENKPSGVTYIDESDYPFKYAFVLKNNLYISLDITTGHEFTPKNGKPSNQFTWVENILKKSTSYDRIITFGHIPIIPVAIKRESGYIRDNFGLLNLFKRYNVDYYLNGHHHTYYPGDIEGLLHITQGCLGSGQRKLIGGNGLTQPKSYTLIKIAEVDSISAIKIKDLKVLNHKSLPAKILFKNRVLNRIN